MTTPAIRSVHSRQPSTRQYVPSNGAVAGRERGHRHVCAACDGLLRLMKLVCFKTTWAAVPGCPASRHFRCPRDMPLEAKRFRHVAVAIPVFAIAGIVTVSPRQQSLQPQQPDLAYHQTLIGWRFR